MLGMTELNEGGIGLIHPPKFYGKNNLSQPPNRGI